MHTAHPNLLVAVLTLSNLSLNVSGRLCFLRGFAHVSARMARRDSQVTAR
uniref:Uncharacterized protein n=1 Tax=Anguilla anguilla TaxID=7936 RepID=A0A0E9W8I4_ANGAN